MTSINPNSCYYFIAKEVKPENTIYHLFLLFPLQGNQDMYIEVGIETQGSWNVTCKNIIDKTNVLTLETRYARKYRTFTADEHSLKKEIVIHTYLSNSGEEENTSIYQETTIDLASLATTEFTKLSSKIDTVNQVAWDCPYVQLNRDQFATPIPALIRFFPRVLIPCLGCKTPDSPAWKRGIVDHQQLIDIPAGRETFRTFIPLIKTGKKEMGIISDLAINDCAYFDSGLIDGVFEPTVIWVEDENQLPDAAALHDTAGNLRDIQTEWDGGDLASVRLNNPSSLPVGNKPRSRGSKTFSVAGIFIDTKKNQNNS